MFNIFFSIAFLLNIGTHASLCKTFCKQDAKYIEKHLAENVTLKIGSDSYPMSKSHAKNFINNLSKLPPPFISAEIQKVKKRKKSKNELLVPGRTIKYKFKIIYQYHTGTEVIEKFMYVDMQNGKITGFHTSY